MAEVPQTLKHLFNEYRTARLNVHYYAKRLRQLNFYNRGMEIVLAITSSAAVGAWGFWKSSTGTVVWQLLGAVSAILCIVKPILNFPKDMERYNKLWAGYIEMFHDLKSWVDKAKEKEPDPTELERALSNASQKLRTLEVQDDPSPSQKLLKKCQLQVNREIPSESLWPSWITEG